MKNPRLTRYYSLHGGKPDFDEDDEIKDNSKEFIWITILNNCKDFLEEKSNIEHFCVDILPYMPFECKSLSRLSFSVS